MNKQIIAVLLVSILIITILIGGSFIGSSFLGTLSSKETEEYNLSPVEVSELSESMTGDKISYESESMTGDKISYESELELADGVYTGSAFAFGPDLTVEVLVADGLISNVTVISHNEKKYSYYGEAMETIPVQIVETQSLELDAISGATYTSYGIQNAVIDALRDAVISGELPEPTDI